VGDFLVRFMGMGLAQPAPIDNVVMHVKFFLIQTTISAGTPK